MAGVVIPASAQNDAEDSAVKEYLDQTYSIGADFDLTRENSTASVAVIKNTDVNRRSAKNVGNSLIGHGSGLITLQNSGTYYAQNPTFYIRGLQSLSGSTPLILVDGIERSIDLLDPEDVEEVQILKDAAATALFGYKGANGVIYVKTKHGQYNSQTIRVNYEHIFQKMTNRPVFVDAPTYAKAMNEALFNEGQGPFARYSQNDIDAFASGQYPAYYPNVDWVDETFRKNAHADRASIEFSGGGERFRYFTLGSLVYSDGFIKNPNNTPGYSTQDKYVRGNIRTNLDIDLTPTTMFHTNVFASLSEMQAPGAQANLWSMIYGLPSAAFPVKNETGLWGGNSTWSGDNNPVAQSSAAAYYKIHQRLLFFNGDIEQDLGMVTKGLKFNVGASYDSWSDIQEDHSMKYNYGMTSVTGWENGQPVLGAYWQSPDQATTMGTGSQTKNANRRFTVSGSFNYNRAFGDHDIYAQLKYFYENEDIDGVNNKIFRHTASFWGQYTYKGRYSLGVTLAEMGSSRLAPGTKWSFSPNVSLGANLIKNPEGPVNFLKLRGSFGIQNLDKLPGDNVWTYYLQSYQTSGVQYPWSTKYDGSGETTVLQLPMIDPSHEKVRKFDVGVDLSLFGCVNLTADWFSNHHYDIFVDGAGEYSSLIGFTAPFKNAGIVDNTGVDITLDFQKHFGDFTLMAGGTFLYSKSKIKAQGEEPKAYENLVRTGDPLSSTYGLIAEGIFTSQEEIDHSPTQTFSTVVPGDIKYRDVNNDGKIDANDECRIGYSTACPEFFYTFNLGAEYKNFGLVAHFQGTGHYSALANAKGYYWGLTDNTSLSQEVYDGRWSADNNVADALYPRLSSSTNANNERTSTFWLRDRSYLKLRNVELYYNLPSSLLSKTGFINGAKVYVRGIDLFSIDNIDNKDPECTGINTPLSREIAVGARLTF